MVIIAVLVVEPAFGEAHWVIGVAEELAVIVGEFCWVEFRQVMCDESSERASDLESGEEHEPFMFDGEPEITGLTRAGDIRHCFADADKLKSLGWEPQVSVADAIREVCDWVQLQTEADPGAGFGSDRAHKELLAAGLLK